MTMNLIPNFTAAMRLDGQAYLVLGVGSSLGRQAAHALRQFGATVLCSDRDASAADQVAFETNGLAIPDPGAPAMRIGELLEGLAEQGRPVDGVVGLTLAARRPLDAELARLAGRHCAAHGAGVLVLVADGGDLTAAEGRFASTVISLAQEFADDGMCVTGVVPPRGTPSAAAGIVAFLCSALGRSLSGQVLLASAAMEIPS